MLSDFRGYHHNPCSNVRGVAHRLHRRSTRPWTSTTTTISLKKCLMKRTFAQTCSKRRRRTQFTLRRPWHRRCIRNDSRSSKGLLCSCDLASCQPRRHRRRDQSQAAVGSAHVRLNRNPQHHMCHHHKSHFIELFACLRALSYVCRTTAIAARREEAREDN